MKLVSVSGLFKFGWVGRGLPSVGGGLEEESDVTGCDVER